MTGNDLLELRGTRTIAVYKYKDRIGNHNFYLSKGMKSFSPGDFSNGLLRSGPELKISVRFLSLFVHLSGETTCTISVSTNALSDAQPSF